MTETHLSFAIIFALDLGLIVSLTSNYRSRRFDFLWYVGLAFVFEFSRHLANASLSLFENQAPVLLISGLFCVSRGIVILHATCSLTGVRFNVFYYVAAFAMLPVVSLIAPLLSESPAVGWYAGMIPIIVLHGVASVVVLARSPQRSQGRIGLSLFLMLSSISLTLLTFYAPVTGELIGLFYLADALFLVLAGIMFVVVALEIVQKNLESSQRDTQESKAQYRQILESAFDGIITIDGFGTVTNLNPQAEAIFGWNPDDLVGRDFADTLLDAGDRPAFRSAIARLSDDASGKGEVLEDVIAERKSHESFPVELIVRSLQIGSNMSINVFCRDLNPQKKAEEDKHRFDVQLQHTQKLESLGILAGGIAHDFNNFLAGILGFAGLAREALEPDAPARADVREIESIAEQAADLTKQLLAYSGRGAFVQKPMQVSALIKEMERLLASTIDKKAELQLDLKRILPLVKCDSSQIGQIVLNLVSNASEALDGQSGNITVTTGLQEATRDLLAKAVADAFNHPGPAVFIEVTDTGCGMDHGTIKKMFEPFFSTKFTGRGLGMAAVIGIVRSHHGALFVDSGVGEGTTIRVLLPVHSETERVAYLTPPEADVDDTDHEWTGSGVALVVDDESSVRTLARQILEKRGFTVVTACDGSEGIEEFKRNSNDLAFVLLDLTMPKVSGIEALRVMRNIRDDVPVILSSGYNESASADGESVSNAAGFIQKPYRASALTDKVRDILFSHANSLLPSAERGISHG